MSVGFPTVGGTGRAERPLSAVPDPRPPSESSFADHFEAATEAGPPPEVRAEVQAALRSADRLQEQGRRLHFDHDPHTGELRIELRDAEGKVMRRVGPGEVFDFATGKAVR